MELTHHLPTARSLARMNPIRAYARLVLLLFAFLIATAECVAQSSNQFVSKPPAPTKGVELERLEILPAAQPLMPAEGDSAGTKLSTESSTNGPSAEAGTASTPQSQFRIEQMPLINGAELLTIFGRLDGMRANDRPSPEVPLISVVRDTLGDSDTENDRLRYVWMLTYTQPTLLKRVAAAIPFLYQHVGNKTYASSRPRPIIDLANIRRQTWNRFLWTGLQNVFLDTYGLPLKASSRSYRRNLADYRCAHVMQALSILGTYENLHQRTRDESELLASSQAFGPDATLKTSLVVNDGDAPLLAGSPPGFTTGEMLELRARLILSGKTLGGLFGPGMFQPTVEKRSMKTVDIRGHNWEILRQRAEAEGLYFEPLTMPDGTATHALLWIAKSDLAAHSGLHFGHRFLNITDPWSDQRLRNWNGYTQMRYLDRDNRAATPTDPKARGLEMIPLALYGLDHPNTPALLVDFRNNLNPKKRELSRRILHDLAKNVFSLSSFGNIPYFLGRTTYDFVTGRRGMDLNQPSRLQSYAELKLLLSFNGSIDPRLRTEIERRLEHVSLNPLSNDNRAEIQLARQQYDALIDYARQPDGLPARIERDRRTEMVALEHGRTARFFFNLGNLLTFGRYVHRETATPQLTERMDVARRAERHAQFLSKAAKSSPQIEIVWDLNNVRHSLQFLADQGAGANGSAARAASAVFGRTKDDETRRLCLDALYRINSKTAKNELLRLYRDQQPGSEWRLAIAERLRKAVVEDSRMKPADARSVLNQVGQP